MVDSTKYDKLVRDKIPLIIEANGSIAVVETLEGDEYQQYLNAKLDEELKEYIEEGSVEELADLVEVIYALLDYKEVTRKAFEDLRVAKVNERGAFRKRLLLKEVIKEEIL